MGELAKIVEAYNRTVKSYTALNDSGRISSRKAIQLLWDLAGDQQMVLQELIDLLNARQRQERPIPGHPGYSVTADGRFGPTGGMQ